MANRIGKRKDVLHYIHQPFEHPAGVYRIWSPNLGKSYVGSSGDLKRRCLYHWNEIQKDLFEYSSYFKDELLAGNLEFTILEYVPSTERLSGKSRGPLTIAEERWATDFHSKGELLNSSLGQGRRRDRRPTYSKAQLLDRLATARRMVQTYTENLARMGVVT